MRYSREQLATINADYEKFKHKLEEIKEKEADELIAFYKGKHGVYHNKPGYEINVPNFPTKNPNRT